MFEYFSGTLRFLNKEKRGFPVYQPKQESIEDRFGDIALVKESSAKNVLKYDFPQAGSQYGVDHASRTAAMSEEILTSHCSATGGLLAMDFVILNHAQVTTTTPEVAPPILSTAPHQRKKV
ncbi:hypothetical protein TNCV_78991 [Trichonephila clavipes]|nr:hypothetical protein TNCV_78991 [Trichonephila clavipes]